jgi:hypothetical protein
VWLNGAKVAGKDRMAGMFQRFRFDVTAHVRPGRAEVVNASPSAVKGVLRGHIAGIYVRIPPETTITKQVWSSTEFR